MCLGYYTHISVISAREALRPPHVIWSISIRPYKLGGILYITIRLPTKLTARAVNNADYQVLTEKSLADVGMPWQSSAIGDGKLCLTAGKPQSGTACVKGCYHKLCASKWHNIVRRLRRRYIVWDSLLRRFRCATPAVKHSEAPSALSSQYISPFDCQQY